MPWKDSGFLKNAPNYKKEKKTQKQKIHFGFSRNRIKVRSAEGGCAVALNVLAAFFALMIAGTNIFFPPHRFHLL